jgi:hypothetical protein
MAQYSSMAPYITIAAENHGDDPARLDSHGQDPVTARRYELFFEASKREGAAAVDVRVRLKLPGVE